MKYKIRKQKTLKFTFNVFLLKVVQKVHYTLKLLFQVMDKTPRRLPC